jgi:hypothetical protein
MSPHLKGWPLRKLYLWPKLTNLKGTNHPRCKLSDKQVIEIREIGFSQTRTSLSKKYGVSRITILRIIERANWNHI